MPVGRPKYQAGTMVGSRSSSRYSSRSATQAKRTVGVAGRTRYSQWMVATNMEPSPAAGPPSQGDKAIETLTSCQRSGAWTSWSRRSV
jgi:hypothetical protein